MAVRQIEGRWLDEVDHNGYFGEKTLAGYLEGEALKRREERKQKEGREQQQQREQQEREQQEREY